MRVTTNASYPAHAVPPEFLIGEHLFLYSIKGTTTVYDGSRQIAIQEGDSCVVGKNQLVRFIKQAPDNQIETICIRFHMPFLAQFQQRRAIEPPAGIDAASIVSVGQNYFINAYIQSLQPYYDEYGQLDPLFTDIKREELLLILLSAHPALAGLLFNFDWPQKVDLITFMSQHFRFNMPLDRFAYLSGRSLSSFKREFQLLFKQTPGQWLTHKRLDEAYFLIQTCRRKPAEFYLELGFEDLSHFLHAFKARFGITPRQLLQEDEPGA